MHEVLSYLRATGQEKNGCELVWAEIETLLLHKVAPAFWKPFKNPPEDERDAFDTFHLAIKQLFLNLSTFDNTVYTLNVLQNGALDRFKSLAQGILLARAPFNHQNLVKKFFDLSFKVFCHSDDSHDDSAEGLFCQGCSQEADQCVCKDILEKFGEVNRLVITLHELWWNFDKKIFAIETLCV
jgi:hypothetical protein